MADPVTPVTPSAAPTPKPSNNANQPIVSGVSQTAEAKPPVQAEEFFDVLIDGETQRLTKTQAQKLISKAGYADKTVRQTKEALKRIRDTEAELNRRIEAAKSSPDELLRMVGIDPDEYARSILQARIRETEMTPEQKRIAELEAQQQAYEAKLAEQQQQEMTQQQQVLVTQIQKQMESELFEASERAGLPRDADTFYAIYEAVREASELGLPWDADRIVEVAQQSIDGASTKLEKAVLNGLTGDALLKRLGPKVVQAVNQAQLEQLRGKKVFGSQQPAPVAIDKSAQKANPYMTPKEAEEKLRKLGAK